MGTPFAAQAPRLLLVTTKRWYSVARLALAAHDAGFQVELVCPNWSGVERLKFLDRVHSHSPIHPERSLLRAIRRAKPDLIIPSDDLAAARLRGLHQKLKSNRPATVALRRLIAGSLGRPEQYQTVLSRAAILSLAEAERVRCPATRAVPRLQSLAAVAGQIGFPAMLKSDGSSGGQGVALVRDLEEAVSAYRRLTTPPSLRMALRQSLVARDHGLWSRVLTRTPPGISLQAYAPGRPGTASVACWNGEVLDMVVVAVVESLHATGPATVVRYVDNPDMTHAIRQVVRRLGLSGLCGFDFILSEADGSAAMIELNARATPTAHLPANQGRDLMRLLHAAVRGQALPAPTRNLNGELVALYPGEWRRDSSSRWLDSGRHDRPDGHPDLVALGQERLESARRKPFNPRRAAERRKTPDAPEALGSSSPQRS